MCGIVGFTGAQNAAPILLAGLKNLEYRGYDSAGIAVLDKGRIAMAKASGQIANLCRKTDDGAELKGTTGIGHTRWATHGAPTDINAHPHLSNNGRFAVVHNGIIENYVSLREELISKGFKFNSETDTEVIAHLLDMYYEAADDCKVAVLKTAARLEGSYALGVICADCPGKVFAVKEASPLILGVGVGENFFASVLRPLYHTLRIIIYLSR
jgi:glucosamine--fructose-6-phosphate aminotransferase (isomerizing)